MQIRIQSTTLTEFYCRRRQRRSRYSEASVLSRFLWSARYDAERGMTLTLPEEGLKDLDSRVFDGYQLYRGAIETVNAVAAGHLGRASDERVIERLQSERGEVIGE